MGILSCCVSTEKKSPLNLKYLIPLAMIVFNTIGESGFKPQIDKFGVNHIIFAHLQ